MGTLGWQMRKGGVWGRNLKQSVANYEIPLKFGILIFTFKQTFIQFHKTSTFLHIKTIDSAPSPTLAALKSLKKVNALERKTCHVSSNDFAYILVSCHPSLGMLGNPGEGEATQNKVSGGLGSPISVLHLVLISFVSSLFQQAFGAAVCGSWKITHTLCLGFLIYKNKGVILYDVQIPFEQTKNLAPFGPNKI